MPLDRSTLIPALKNMATELRIDSIKSTSEAGSGHPTSCMSAADIVVNSLADLPLPELLQRFD